MSPKFSDHSVGLSARKSFAQHLLPSWIAALKADAKSQFLTNASSLWLLIFPEDILPDQSDEFYQESRRLEVCAISISEARFLRDCARRFSQKNLPDTPERCTERDDIIRQTMISRKMVCVYS